MHSTINCQVWLVIRARTVPAEFKPHIVSLGMQSFDTLIKLELFLNFIKLEFLFLPVNGIVMLLSPSA